MFKKLPALCMSAALALILLGTGCGNKTSSTTTSTTHPVGAASPAPTPKPTPTPTATSTSSGSNGAAWVVQGGAQSEIVMVNGSFGYYMDTFQINNPSSFKKQFCDTANNFCGTGISYGITTALANGAPVIVVTDSCGNQPSGCWGYYLNNNPQGTLCIYANNYCGTGNANGIGTAGESYMGNYGGMYMSNGVYTGPDTTSPTSSGGIIGSNGVYTGPDTTSPGSSGGIAGSTGVLGSSGSSSINDDTKDVDLQRAALQEQQIEDQAQGLASQFSMNIDAARSLTQIANKMSALTNQVGGMTDDDRAALTGAALSVAGISSDQVNQAYAAYFKGDKSAVDNLVNQAAVNLGMPSDAGLRDQILPSLGISLGQ